MPGLPAEVARTNGRQSKRQGAYGKRSGPLAARIAGGDNSPIAVMYRNMLFWCDKTDTMEEQLRTLVIKAESVEERREAFTLLREFLSARQKSQDCAVDLAPYVHPKLASINIAPMDDNSILDLKALPEGDALVASDAYAKMLATG